MYPTSSARIMRPILSHRFDRLFIRFAAVALSTPFPIVFGSPRVSEILLRADSQTARFSSHRSFSCCNLEPEVTEPLILNEMNRSPGANKNRKEVGWSKYLARISVHKMASQARLTVPENRNLPLFNATVSFAPRSLPSVYHKVTNPVSLPTTSPSTINLLPGPDTW